MSSNFVSAAMTARRRRLRWAFGATLLAAGFLVAGFWTYDALGYQQAVRFQEEHSQDPGTVLSNWESYQRWHPTRFWLRSASAQAEAHRLQELQQKFHRAQGSQELAHLKLEASNPDADPAQLWRRYQQFQAEYPDVSPAEVKEIGEKFLNRAAQRAYDRLLHEEKSGDLAGLVARAEQLLADFPGSSKEADVRGRREGYLRRLDERDFQPIRDQFEANPGAVVLLGPLCRTYLTAHPQGRFASAANEVLRWCGRISTTGAYRVVLKSGHFDKKVARTFSRGPDLSVEIEVNGIRHGPSQIVANQYDPEWNYEFPRPIEWKSGDAVRIKVTEHDWKKRVVLDFSSDDPLAMKFLSGEIKVGKNRLTFASDFALPSLPMIP